MKYTGTFLLLILIATPLLASDLGKEKRWAEQIEQGLMDGEMIDLQADGQKFLALETVAAELGDTAVIVLHGIGAHPDWPDIVYPLRVTLPESGLTTVSLQLPVLANEAEAHEYAPLMKEASQRISSGVNHLINTGYKRIFLVAHSLGAEMASYYLALGNAPASVKGYVGIGMNVNNPKYLAKISIPVLDLYGADDLEGVLKSAADRAAASSGNEQFFQNKVESANHFFNEKDEALLQIVTEWIKQH